MATYRSKSMNDYTGEHRARGRHRHNLITFGYLDDHNWNWPLLAAFFYLGSLPILAIPAHLFGVVDISWTGRYVILPAAALFMFLVVIFHKTKEAGVAIRGLLAGLVAVLVYDATRWFFTLAGTVNDPIPGLGAIIEGSGGENFALGYLWRYFGNAGGLAVAFFIAISVFAKYAPVRNHAILTGVGYGVFVWSGLMATVIFSVDGANALFAVSPEALYITLLGHVIFGGILGAAYLFFRGHHFRVPSLRLVAAVFAAIIVVSGIVVVAGDKVEFIAAACKESEFAPHDGNQEGERCVSIPFGEVATEENSPTLLITSAPQAVGVNEPFEVEVSTRNLVRDDFDPAGQGGYYRSPSRLNEEGLNQGHVHFGCRILPSLNEAPDPVPPPEDFNVNEDGLGGAEPDTFVFDVTDGLPEPGTYQCSAWAGDQSHRMPLMQRANQTPAFDSVRVEVR